MTNHTPVFTSSSASGSFTETSNTTGSTTLHTLTGTMNFTDSDHSDTHTTTATLHSTSVSGGTIIPSASLAHFQAAMTSQITTDSNGSGKLKWTFADTDNDFDFLSKNQTLVLTYDIQVSDNHGGTAIQTVKVTVTGTDDKPVITTTAMATVTEQADQTLSLSPDTVHVALNFTDVDLANTGHTATVLSASATGNTSGIIFGNAELMSFFHVDNVIKNAGSSDGVINTTFSGPDLAFDYLAAGEHLDITYVVQLDDHAGGVSTQNVQVTVVGTNDKPIYLSGPESAHLIEDQNVNSSGDLTAHGDLFFTDIDLSDTHAVSTTVSATRSGGGTIPLTDAQLLAAFATSLEDSTGHVLGEVDWNFAFSNSASSFLSGGETLTLVYHVTVQDPSGATATQDVTVTILGTNHPVMITSGAESASAFELDSTTGSTAIDTTTTVPAGTLNFSDPDTGDTHTVTTTLASTSWSGGGSVPAATQADLAAALTTTLNDSTGTGNGSVDWNFGIQDKDLDFLAAGETLTVNYNVKVSDASTNSTQTVSVTVTGANDAVVVSSGPQSGSTAEQANTTNSTSLDTTSPAPTGTLAFTDVDLSDVHSVSVSLDSAVWSGDPTFVPGETLADLQAALMTTLHDSNGTGSGGVDWSFAIADRDLDFLSAGETLTATYSVTVMDGSTSSTQTVTVTMTGADDPLIATPVTVTVTDTAFPDAGQLVASGTLSDLAHPIDISSSRSVTEVNGSAANVGAAIAGAYGTLILNADGSYSYVANSAIDPLQVGDNPTDQFTFTVSDTHGHNTTSTLTFDITGGNDIPLITAANANGSVTEDAGPAVIVNGGFETGDLTGWSTSGTHIHVQQLEFGGGFGHYTAELAPTGAFETLAQNVTTSPGQHYFISFTVIGDPEAGHTPLNVMWDGHALLSSGYEVPGGVNHYAFDVIASTSTTALQFSYADDGTGLLLDEVNVSPATGPATESTTGAISFSDLETADTHTASFTPQGGGYVGAFTLDPVTDGAGSGSVDWHFTVNNADIQYLAQGQSLIQDYQVEVSDNHGGSTFQDVTVTINGTNDAPTAVSENVITDVGANGTVDIPAWALALNDTDPDTTDHVFAHSILSSSGGTAGSFSFTDDATLGGSFTYDSSDGTATSSNAATATVVNNATITTALVGTSGDDVIIATNGTESLSGGGGNDVLIGNDGAHTMTGGSGNDTFAFLQPSNGVGTITDFNNTTQHDHIAISASGYGGGLTPNMDVTSLFETSGDDQFSGSGAEFHFDTANQTLYFSADGTQASVHTLLQVQAGVTINPHDLLIV
jgi:VCBS repeat-containing protein